MTRDDILRMAREAGFVLSSNATGEAMDRFDRFAALVAAAEREAWIAALRPAITQRMGAEQVREAIQKAIRSRGAHAQNPV